jgi:type II secretion system-associated lipoprotein
LTLINEHYSQNTYYVKENLVLDNKEVIKKDTSVKIWIESTASILKVKCYNSNEERESAVGKMVAYIINEDFKAKQFTVEYLDQLIAEKLVYYDAKDVSKNKKAKK